MLYTIGLLHDNIQYGTLQLQLYNSGQQTLSDTSSVMPKNESTQLFCSHSTQHNLSEEPTLNNTFEIELAQEDEGYERGSKI